MEKFSRSRWIPRRLEERIVYGGGGGSDEEHLSNERIDVPRGTHEDEEKFAEFLEDAKEKSKCKVKVGTGEREVERKGESVKESCIELIERGQIEKDDFQLTENKEKVVSFVEFGSVVQNFEKDITEFEQEKEDFNDLNQVEEEQEKSFRKFETVILEKRRQRILREIEEEEIHRSKLNQSFDLHSYTGEKSREKRMILDIPGMEELESTFEIVLSKLEQLGFDERKLERLMQDKQSREDLRKLIGKILEPKFYGRGLCKLVVQDFI